MITSLICAMALGSNNLPKVLLIGDSISQGYTPFVKEMMADTAQVVRIPGNGRNTGFALTKIEEWLGETKWDVIHFNWGLHDLCYRHPDSKVYGNRDKVKGKITHTPEVYEANLEQLVIRLKKSGAKLIWATTTPVPPGEAGRFVEDAVRYNHVAATVMKRHRITVNNLHDALLPRFAEFASLPGDVHLTKDGYRFLAEHVVSAIKKHLDSGSAAIDFRSVAAAPLP